MGQELNPEESARGKETRMARRKRQYGSGSLLRRGRGWAIRWRGREMTPDGLTKGVLNYENLGVVTRTEAARTLAQRVAAAGTATIVRARVSFGELATDWQAQVVPMYKYSTQKNHR